jgi:N12 class adenine-specific DNA methylase
VKYVGWGGLKSVFDEGNAETAADRATLKELLTPKEFEAARRSVLDAHYTSATVIEGIYKGLDRLGFSGGRVLEPGMGIGHFFGLMPPGVAASSQLFGVELDPTTGGIARQLYQRADIKAPRGFQEVNIPAEYFDAAIGNPPFGKQPIVDESGAEIPKLSIHNFFFAKAVHSLRPGGVLAMVTSHYFLDANQSAARGWIAKRAELLGAIRLPNNAFLKNAGTEVTTDIVFLRKLKKGENADASWTKIGELGKDEATGQPIYVSNYFVAHPEMMLGRMTLAGTMYGGNTEPTLEPNKGEDLGKALEGAIGRLPQGVFQAAPRTVEELAPVDVIVPDGVKVGGLFALPDSRLAVRTPDVMDKPQHSIYEAPNERAIARIRGMIGIRDAVRNVMRDEMADESTERLDSRRSELNRVYDSFLAKHGYINSLANRRAFQDDPDLPLLESLERHYDPGVSKDVAKRTGETPRAPSAEKATIFTKRVISPAQVITKADSASDALAASLSERGKVDLPYMAQLYGKPPADILKELAGVVFNDPKAGYVTADEYLSGNVKRKLAEVREAAAKDPQLKENVEALERVQPPDIAPVDISVRLGSPWIPAKDVADFIHSLLDVRPDSISYQPAIASWVLSLPYKNTSAFSTTWGAKTDEAASWGADRIIAATLNSKPIIVRKNVGTAAEPKLIVLEAETDAARAKAEAIAAKFTDWIFQDQTRRDRLARLYNDKFNTDRVREFNGSHLTLPGTNPSITLTPNKKHSVWRMIQSKSTLLDHVVGSGKTYTIAAAMMEKRRLGISRKPMVVVPNHIVRQWRDSWYALYPNANILATTEEDFEKGNRQRLFARIATGDWDAVIVSHSAFGKIAMPKAERDEIVREQINDITAAIEELKKGKGERYTVRQLELAKAKLEDKLKIAESKTAGKDKFIDFSELGVDDLAVDESQEFKNLFYTSQMRNVTGMGNPEGSGKAFDLFVKTRYLAKRNGKVTFATGTPMSNSLVEMFTIQRYMDYDTLRGSGLSHLDAWAGTYADIKNVWEVHPSGNGYRLATRFAQFVNLPELVTQYRKFADIITQQDMIDQAKAQGGRYPIPKMKTGKPIMHIAKRSPMQAEFFGIPEFVRDEDGKLQFERALDDGDVMSREDWIKVFSTGAESDAARWPETEKPFAIVGRSQQPEEFFATRAEAKTALEGQRDTPRIEYNKDSILWQYENLRDLMRESEGKINALSITNQARKAGLDYRIIDPGAEDFDGSKINEAADEITALHKAWKADRGAQLVFIDLSTPKGTPKAAPQVDQVDGETVINMDELLAGGSAYSVYDALREKLIQRGVPAREIAFIHDAHTQEQKRKLFGKVNRGEVRVLFGSSFKMGAGTNVQERLVGLHHLDVPWRPSDLEQREGRILRQGNDLYARDPEGFEVAIHRYATEKTYDARSWQIIQHKASGFEQFRRGQAGARKMEDIGGEAANAADMKAASSGNPMIAEEIKLRDRLKKLGNIFDAWRSGRYGLENDVERWKKYPAKVAAKVKALEALIDSREPKQKEGFTLTLADGAQVTKADGIAPPLVAAMKQAMKAPGTLVPIGKYRGFYVFDTYTEWSKLHSIEATPKKTPGPDDATDNVTAYGEHDQFSPSGFISRLDNYLDKFEKRIEEENASAEKTRNELKKAQAELAKPFEHEKELDETRARLQQVQAALLKSGGSIEMTPAMRKELAAAIKERRGAAPEETALRREGIHGLAGVTVQEAQQVVDVYRKAFKGLPEVNVAKSVSEAPEGLRDAIAKLGGEDDTAGAWHDGEIWLFTDNLTSQAHAEWVLLHEATHHGLRGLLGENRKPVLMDLYNRHAELRKLANEQRRTNPKLSVIAATEEALANLGADGVPQGIMQQLVAAVRRALRAAGVKLRLSDGDVHALVAAALRSVKNPPAATEVMSGTALQAGAGEEEGPTDERPGAPPVKPGQPFIVYRVGNRETLENANGGNADSVARHLAAFDDFERPSGERIGQNVMAFEVTLKEPFGKYGGMRGRGEAAASAKAVGRVVRGEEIAYSFPKAGETYTVRLVAKVPLAKVRAQLEAQGIRGGSFDEAGTALGSEAIRAVVRAPETETALSRTTSQPPAPRGRGSLLSHPAVAAGYRAWARKAVDTMDGWLDPISTLPKRDEYLIERYKTLGVISKADELAAGIRAAFEGASDEDKQAVYDYLVTAGATPEGIKDAGTRQAAEKVKAEIGKVGDGLVARGMLSEESREAYRDGYLPRIYLKHLLSEADFGALGAGKKPSNMGYLKQRKDIPEDVRRVILGEITDPGYLAAVAVAKPLRDMVLLDWLSSISQKEQWVLPGVLVKWGDVNLVNPAAFPQQFGKKLPERLVSAYWLKEEAARLRKQSEHQDDATAKKAIEVATLMERTADKALDGMPADRKQYKQIPDTARYGHMRGLWVRREIYDDLMGVNDFIPADPGIFQSIFGYGGIGTRITQVWKTLKVALNLPSQVRNGFSNFVQLNLSGVALPMAPLRVIQAVREIFDDGEHWKIAKKYGVKASTFSSQELYRAKRELLTLERDTKGLSPFAAMHHIAAKVMEWGGDAYQFSESVFKTAKIIDMMAKGETEQKAMLEAQKWLYDYSLVHRNVRYLRNAPIGVPFLTFLAKSAPRMAEVALLHPWRFLPYAAVLYGMAYAVAAMYDVDKDDLEKLKKALPEWLQDRGHTMILPFKDDRGRWQVLDLGYFFPWTQFTEIGGNVKEGEPGKAIKSAGLFSGPFTDMLTAIKTGKDSFTGRDIYKPGDPPTRQAIAIMNYLWTMAAPPMLTDMGFVGHAARAYTGETNKYGDPVSTPSQAALRLIGVNVYAMEPEQTRAANIRKQEFEIGEVKKAAAQRLADRSLSDERRTALIEEYRQEAVRRQEKLVKYIAESGIHPNLETAR